MQGSYSIIIRDKNGEVAGLCLNSINNNLENKNSIINSMEETTTNFIDSNSINLK